MSNLSTIVNKLGPRVAEHAPQIGTACVTAAASAAPAVGTFLTTVALPAVASVAAGAALGYGVVKLIEFMGK